MNKTYKEVLAACIQYYVDRGYTFEHATAYVTTAGENDIFRIYEIIQEEMKKQTSAVLVGLLQEI